jgi:hypothetical protein
MRKSIHAMTLAEAFARAGGQSWRREREESPEHVREQEEVEAARTWLAHVEAGRIGG